VHRDHRSPRLLRSSAAKHVAGAAHGSHGLDMLNPKFAEAHRWPRTTSASRPNGSKLIPEGLRQDQGVCRKAGHATGKLPTVLVIHENRGLNPHIEDIARVSRLDNFLAGRARRA
jgi:carboxymethylenebutenolidase